MDTISTPSEESRPQFLTVLCILTFIGTGLMLGFSLIGIPKTFIRSAEERASQREMTYQKMMQFNPAAADAMLQAMEEEEKYEKPNWILSFGCNLLSLFGALMMWKQKKTGFYLYLAGEILPYILPLILLGGINGMKSGMGIITSLGGLMQGFAIAVIAFMIIADIAFFIMYALNLRHMK